MRAELEPNIWIQNLILFHVPNHKAYNWFEP